MHIKDACLWYHMRAHPHTSSDTELLRLMQVVVISGVATAMMGYWMVYPNLWAGIGGFVNKVRSGHQGLCGYTRGYEEHGCTVGCTYHSQSCSSLLSYLVFSLMFAVSQESVLMDHNIVAI